MVEAAPHAMILVCREGRILFANREAEKMFGYSRNEMDGCPVEILVPPSFDGLHIRHRESFFKSPEPKTLGTGRDLFALRKDGSVFPVEIGLNPVETPRGTMVVTTVVNLTERKREEKKLRDSEERFRLTLESIKDHAIFLMDPEGRVMSWNTGAERIKGYKLDEIIGRNYACFYPEDQIAQGLPAEHLRIAREQGRFEEENWRVRKDGSQFLGSVIITPMYGDNQELRGFSKVTRDITERRLAEERFRLAVEAAPNAMIMVDQQGAISYANRQTELLFGYPRQELIGQRLETLVPERFRAAHAVYRQEYFHQPSTRAMGAGRDLYGLRKDGAEIPIEIGLNPISTAEGPLVLASIIDITERIRLTRELQTFEKMSALGVMAAGVAHELNNPIMGVLNFIQYAIKHLDSAHKAAPVLKDAETEIQRCTKIISSLLTFAHADKRGENFYRDADLAAVLERVLNRLLPRMEAEGIRLTQSIDPVPVWAKINEGGIEQVLLNLVSNALDAMRNSPCKELRIALSRKPGQVLLTVSDSGAGIAREIMPKIFDPFFTTKPPGQGTGLGLSICRSIIRDHQGDLSCESLENRGTTFRIVLPAADFPELPPPGNPAP